MLKKSIKLVIAICVASFIILCGVYDYNSVSPVSIVYSTCEVTPKPLAIIEEPDFEKSALDSPVEEVILEEPEYKGLLTPSNLTPDELESGLLYNLKDYSECFIQAEEETGVNAIFLSAVAALESGWARSNISNEKNNLFGWTSYSKGYATFNSKEECIIHVAKKIKELYLSEDGAYFNGYEVSDVNVYYNGSQFWEDNVTLIMSQIQSRIQYTKGE